MVDKQHTYAVYYTLVADDLPAGFQVSHATLIDAVDVEAALSAFRVKYPAETLGGGQAGRPRRRHIRIDGIRRSN